MVTYLIILFLGAMIILLGLVSTQLLRMEKAVIRISEKVEEESLDRLE